VQRWWVVEYATNQRSPYIGERTPFSEVQFVFIPMDTHERPQAERLSQVGKDYSEMAPRLAEWQRVAICLQAARRSREEGRALERGITSGSTATVSQVTVLRVVLRPEKRKPAEQARLDAIRGGSVELRVELGPADEFAELRSQGTLSDWLVRGEACLNPKRRWFAEGIRRDEAAVLAAVTQPWSHGPVESHVNRQQAVKRQMYGRPGSILLRAGVVRAP
jgi:transposase